jgi:tyrosine-protein kinase Etk/Wzc
MKDYSNHQKRYNDDSEIDLATLFNIIKIHKWIIVAALCFGFIVGYLISISIIPQYQSSAIIQVDNQITATNMLSGLSKLTGKASTASQSQIQTALLKSAVLLKPLALKLGLNITVTPRYFPLFGKMIANNHSGSDIAKPVLHFKNYAWGGEKATVATFTNTQTQYDQRPFTLIAEKNQRYKLISPDRKFILSGEVGKTATTKNHNISIRVSTLKARPGEAFTVKRIPVQYAIKRLQAALQVTDTGRTSLNSNNNTGILKVSLNWPNKQQVPIIINELTAIARQQNITDKSQKAAQALKFTANQIPKITSKLNKSEHDLTHYKAKIGVLDIQSEAKNLLLRQSELTQQIQQLEANKLQLAQYDQPSHPAMINLQAQIDQLKKQASQLKQHIKTTPLADQKAIALTRDVKIKEAMYSNLVNNIQQLQLLKAGTISDVKILNHATTPLLPLPMHKNIIILSTTLGFTLLTIIILIMKQLLSAGISDPQTLEDKFSVAVQAVIPFSPSQSKLNRKRSEPIKILSLKNPKDPSIEGIRSLRTALSLSLLESNNNIINIIGASPGIGKSFVAINLAQTFAENDKKVILLCCDLRKGKTHQIFNKLPSPGLSEYLKGNKDISHIIQRTSTIDLITSGHYPKNPSELLSNNRFSELLDYCQQHYDIVITDTPPVLAVTDACIIAQHSDLNLLTVGLGKNQANEISATLKRLAQNKIQPHGLVCNYYSKTAMNYSSHSYNYYYYHYK